MCLYVAGYATRSLSLLVHAADPDVAMTCSEDMMLQQDISDFCHMFLDLVEDGMKNTTVEGELDRLFGVKVRA